MNIFNCSTISDFQKINADWYGDKNSRSYSPERIVSRMHRYITLMLKAIRRDQREQLGEYAALAFSWTLALANHLRIDLEEHLWINYPDSCPYCGTNPHSCGAGLRRLTRQDVLAKSRQNIRPNSLTGFQRMLGNIYPKNTLLDCGIHLAEEIGELDEAVDQLVYSSDTRKFDKVLEEIVDVLANLLAVCTCAQVELQTEIQRLFSSFCPGCHHAPCKCNPAEMSSANSSDGGPR